VNEVHTSKQTQQQASTTIFNGEYQCGTPGVATDAPGVEHGAD